MTLRLLLAAAGIFAAAALAAADAPPQRPAYATFHMVRTRNIFDPDRRPMAQQGAPAPRPAPAAPAAPDYVALTGIMVTSDKAFAFFSGSRTEFNAVLAVSGTVANMKVTKITPAQVEVSRAGHAIVIAVGQQLALNSSTPVAATPPADTQAPAPDSSPGPVAAPPGIPADQQDLVRRMMERRQHETSR